MLVGDEEGAEIREWTEHGCEAVGPLRVGHDHDAAGVLEGKGQLLGAPPHVEGDGDGAGQQRPPERDDPLGQVAHGDGHPVPLGDPVVRTQATGKGGGEPVVVGEGDVLVLVDEEVGGAMAP